MQFHAFDDSETHLGSAHLGSWVARTDDKALERLRLFVREALVSMSAAAARAARFWVEDAVAERQFRDALAGGAMYVHVIADGTTFWELSGRPLLYPKAEENRPSTWTTVAVADGRHGRWRAVGLPCSSITHGEHIDHHTIG